MNIYLIFGKRHKNKTSKVGIYDKQIKTGQVHPNILFRHGCWHLLVAIQGDGHPLETLNITDVQGLYQFRTKQSIRLQPLHLLEFFYRVA